MSNGQQQEESLIFCDMSVFTDEERDRHMSLAGEIFSKVSEVRESEDGYALRLPDEDGIILKLADFINDDRNCCTFIHFGIDIEAYGKGICLLLKGDTADAKSAIKGELLGLVPDEIAGKN